MSDGKTIPLEAPIRADAIKLTSEMRKQRDLDLFKPRFGGRVTLHHYWNGPTGKWACRASIHEGRTGYHQCGKAASIQDEDGYWWCGVHSPLAVAKRKAKSNERYEAHKAKWADADRKRAEADKLLTNAPRYIEALRQIAAGHNDPRALAIETLGELLEPKSHD